MRLILETLEVRENPAGPVYDPTLPPPPPPPTVPVAPAPTPTPTDPSHPNW